MNKCGCGCNEECTRKFLPGHHMRLEEYKEQNRIRNKQLKTGRKLSPEHCANISRGSLGIPKPEGHSSKERNPNWRNGTSAIPTPSAPELKTYVRKRDNFTCQECGDEGHFATIINFDKTDVREDNLITLCRSCLSKRNKSDREEDIERLTQRARENGSNYNQRERS